MCKIKNCKRKKIESVYSEKFHLVQKKLSALWSVRFMIVRFIEPSATARLIEVPALYRVRFREIPLYMKMNQRRLVLLQ